MLQVPRNQDRATSSSKKSSKGKGTRSRTGAGMSRRIDFGAEMERINSLDESERHLTGHLYQTTNGKVYDQSQILLDNYFWFEPGRPMPFAVMDCLVHAVNYIFRHPIFVTRDQVHQLALRRSKKAKSYLAEVKVETRGTHLAAAHHLLKRMGLLLNEFDDRLLK